MGYIKNLDTISPEQPEYARAVKLLGDLYHMLCYGCGYYIFSTDDPFRSVSWSQQALFGLWARKVFQMGYTRENIRMLLQSAASSLLSRESLSQFQEEELLALLKTSDLKYMAIEEAKKLVEEKEVNLYNSKKQDSRSYSYGETINHLCDMILMTAITLAEPELAVEYYFSTCREANKEIVLYRALRLVRWLGDAGLWMEVYRYGLAKKIKPREELRREFEALQAGEEMEKGFWL